MRFYLSSILADAQTKEPTKLHVKKGFLYNIH